MLELNQIYNLNCLDGMKQIRNGTIDMILSDLPYGITECEFDKVIPFIPLWSEYKRIIKPNGAIILTAKQPFTTDLICSNREWYRYNMVWMKNISTGFLNSKVLPLQTHEDICVFYRHKPTYNPQMESGFSRKISKASSMRKCKAAEIYSKAINLSDYDSTERYPISVIYFESDKNNSAIHPTQKPVALFEYLIRTYSNETDVVLDTCMGSGTTAIACINTNRQFIGFETSKKYFEKSQERIYLSTSQLKFY